MKMTKKQKHWLEAGIFLILLAVSRYGLALLFRPKNNRQDFGMDEMKANGILAEPENTIDVVALGDSECALAISPMVMWREKGIAAYNCGTAGESLYETYGYLRQALEKQKPRLVILETNVIYKECKLEDYLFAKLERLIPALRYHDRWKSLRAEDLGPVEYTWQDPYRGYMFYADIVPADVKEYMFPTSDVRYIARWGKKSLDEIVKLCREAGAELILVSTPSALNWSYPNHNGIQALANEYGLTYLDMNLLGDELGIDWKTDTKDQGDHMNCFGAEKVSRWLAGWLKDNFDVPDHRGEEAYGRWDEDLKTYEAEWESVQS